MDVTLPLEPPMPSSRGAMTTDLMDRSRSGRERLLEQLYDDHGAAIYRWALVMLGRPEDAADVVQSVWLRIADRIESVESAENRTAWTWKVARNHVASLLRRRRLERWWTPALTDNAEEPVFQAADGVDAADREDLQRALRRLKPRYRSVALLVGVAGFTLEEAAERLGVPRGTAASRYHGAVQKLKKIMNPGRNVHAAD